MLFNSYPFLFIFLPLTLVIFYGLRHADRRDASIAFLMLASLAFYAYWKPQDTLILIATILWNYSLARHMRSVSPSSAKTVMILGVAGNLGLLIYYKYFNFIATNIMLALHVHYAARAVVMPIGISFFTFTQIAYLVDCYRSRQCESRFTSYGLFVTIFPHLIAGPIIHHAQMRPQFSKLRQTAVDASLPALGILIFIIGLSKKVLIADNLASLADPVFAAADKTLPITALSAWLGLSAYTLQIYFDFSGYSDMAVGLGLMFGLRLPVNFNSPYKSTSIIDFWRRWHISLSNWLRDYLYISLGGNRAGELSRLRNIAITMLLGGIWHGAGWTFVIWGALHGCYIIANHVWRSIRTPRVTAPSGPLRALSWALTILLVMIAWAFFRAHTITGALTMLRAMVWAGPYADSLPRPGVVGLFWLILAGALALGAHNTQQLLGYNADLTADLRAPAFHLAILRSRPIALPVTSIIVCVAFGALLAAVLASIWRPAVFIYFNF